MSSLGCNTAGSLYTLQAFDDKFIFALCSFVVNETLDSILDESGDEEEQEAVVNQVLDEIGIEISGKVRQKKNGSKNYFVKMNSVVVFQVILARLFIQAFCFCTFQMAEAPSAHGGKLPTGQRATASKGSADADIEEMLANLRA